MNTLWTVLAIILAFGIAYVLYVVIRIIFDPEVHAAFRTAVASIKRAYKEASNRVKEEDQNKEG